MIEEVILPIEVDIYYDTSTSPVLGVYSELEQTGFKWDRTLLISLLSERFSYNTYIGGISFSLSNGTIITDWQTGSLDSLSYQKLNTIYRPVITPGNFTVSSMIRKMYSDFSGSDMIQPEMIDSGNNTIQLDTEIESSTLTIASWKRTNKLLQIINEEFSSVSEFTEDTYNNEYIINDDYLLTLNGDYIKSHGFLIDELTWDHIRTWCVFAGNGTGAGRDYFLDYFPVVSSTIRCFVLTSMGEYEEWSLVDNFNASLATDKVFVLNTLLGVISTGGYKPDDLVSSAEISASDIDIPFFMSTETTSYPTSGIVHIGEETIYFGARSSDKLLNCLRGYLGTEAVIHSIGSIIEFEQRGMAVPEDSALYVYYQSSVRVDYELADVSANRSGEVDCRPSKHSTAAKIVQISSKLKDLDSLVLETDKLKISSNVYGPLYIGNDISKLTVTAYDSLENVVDDVAITLEILDPVFGLLDGEFTSTTKYSNSDGKAFYYYNAPVTADDFSIKYGSVEYASGSTIFNVENLDKNIGVNDVFIYQLLKHDPSYGTLGIKHEVDSYTGGSSRPGATFEVKINGKLNDSFNGGLAYFISSDGLIQTRDILQTDQDIIYCSGSSLTVTPVTVWLLTSEDLEWDSENLNGVPVILYTWSNEAEHPITEMSGAWVPIKPSIIADGVITYPYVLPEPKPTERSSNLGGYMIVAPVSVGLRAYAVDPYSGEIIYSNTIYLLVKLPNYLTGVDYSGSLPIPKGFNLITLEENVGNGLGLANFLTINKMGGMFGLQLRFNS